MKLKELKENVVVDIKSEKQLHFLRKLLKDAGYRPFEYSVCFNDMGEYPIVGIEPESKLYYEVYKLRPLASVILLEDVVELEVRDSAVLDDLLVIVYDNLDGDKPSYACKFGEESSWKTLPCFDLKTFIEFYNGKYDCKPVNSSVKIDNEIVKDSIVYYGKDVQSTICMEECAELIQAISKEKRGKSDKNHLAEEMADVLISIELLKDIYDVSNDQINEWVDKKQKRIRSRMK